MIKIIYPPQKPKIKNEEGKESIFCIIRKKWYLLTPEEWVRQNFILSLIHVLAYPAALIAVEKRIVFHEINKLKLLAISFFYAFNIAIQIYSF